MVPIQLKIKSPTEDLPIVGDTEVSFEGSASIPEPLAGVSLHYRWYSSLNPGVGKGKYSINEVPLTIADRAPPPLKQLMPLGSQVIAFAVSDQQGETDRDFNAMQYGAVTGGASGDSRCVIHVFRAVIMAPGDNARLSAPDLVLKAQAPWAWASEDYQGINHLAYQWIVSPKGAPVRPTFKSPVLGQEALTFCESDSSVSYLLELGTSAEQFLGDYEIALELLENAAPEVVRHRSSISVTFI